MANITEFKQLVAGMQSPENESRKQAETVYEQIELGQRAQLLYQVYVDETCDIEHRSMCLVLLRRILSSEFEDLWKAWGQATADQFCAQILEASMKETSAVMRKRLADVVAEVARSTIDENTGKQHWAGVIQFLEHCCTADSTELREFGMQLLENVPNLFGCDQDHYIAGIKQMFQSSLLYAADSSVRTAAVRAFVAFVVDNEEDEKLVHTMSELIPAVIQVCIHVVDTESDDDVPLQCLTDLATTVPKTLQPHLHDIFTLCARTVANTEKDESYRHSSMELMVSICEGAPKFMRKKGAQYVPAILEQCLLLMTDLEDDSEEWLVCDDADAEDDEETAGVGETALDRVACALGGKACLSHFLAHVQPLIRDADWKKRHAAIMGLSTVGEGCKRQMEPMIKQIIDEILPYVTDSHPRVRYAACNAIGQMSTDFAPTLQKLCHAKVVPALLQTLNDLTSPRVSAHAGAALVNFSEDCPKNVITQYLPTIMGQLELVLEQTFRQLLDNGKKIVLEQVITTIASVADAAQDQFKEFYTRLMGPLKYILQNSAQHDQLRLLRGKTIECISLIGLAVGSEMFLNDAREVMQLLLETQTKFDSSSDDPQFSYMISAWARICKILGPQFAEYLPVVMPAVVAAAEYKPDVAVIDDEDVNQDDEDWSFVSVGDQKSFGIRTSGLEDKATACEMLVCYARELKEAFAPYVQQVAQLMIPLLKFVFHDSVRSAAADIMPHLMICARGLGQPARAELWNLVKVALRDAINTENEPDVLGDMLHALGEVIEELGREIVSAEDVTGVATIIHEQMEKYVSRRKVREQHFNEDDDEDTQEEMNELIETENGVLARISDLLHYTFTTFGVDFAPLFEKLINDFAPLLSSRQYGERQWGICLFDDLIEFGGPAKTAEHSHIFLPHMISALSDEYPEVRQAAAYGFGILAIKGGPDFASTLAGALPHLIGLINHPESRSTEESIAATENAISAVSKILKYNSSAVDVNATIPVFLNWLPIWEDTDEAPFVYGYFADLVEANNPIVLGENNANLARILYIIVEAFNKQAFDEESDKENVRGRLVNILRSLQGSNMLEGLVAAANLNDVQRATLQQLLS
uniref:Importin-5 n=1 Tax=Steinernema glaseri TaxID=37863 RepID=A0A1I7YJ02_9BILA